MGMRFVQLFCLCIVLTASTGLMRLPLNNKPQNNKVDDTGSEVPSTAHQKTKLSDKDNPSPEVNIKQVQRKMGPHYRLSFEEQLLYRTTYVAFGTQENIKKQKALTKLIKNVPDVNIVDQYGHTPLHTAVAAKNITAVDLLLQAGADVNAMPERSTGSLLNNSKIKQSALHTAVLTGQIDIVKLLIQNHADVNIANQPDEQSPLHLSVQLAASSGHDHTASKIAKLLIHAGANRLAQDNKALTPFEHIKQHGFYYRQLAHVLRPRTKKCATILSRFFKKTVNN